MDINNPEISRILAILVEDLDPTSRLEFIKDAKKSPDMKSFMEGYKKYSTIYDKIRKGE